MWELSLARTYLIEGSLNDGGYLKCLDTKERNDEVFLLSFPTKVFRAATLWF